MSNPPTRAPRTYMRPVAVVGDCQHCREVVWDVVRRIRDLEKNMGGGAYLFVNRDTREVCLVSENASGARALLERFVDSFVGVYTRLSTEAWILEDIEQHLG